MNMKRFVASCLSLPILAIAFAAHAQTVPFDLEIGYRWLDLKGSNEMYRTQINERGVKPGRKGARGAAPPRLVDG